MQVKFCVAPARPCSRCPADVAYSGYCSIALRLVTVVKCAGLHTSMPNLLTNNPRLSLPLDADRAGEQAQLADSEDAELNSKRRQIQLQLQVCVCVIEANVRCLLSLSW